MFCLTMYFVIRELKIEQYLQAKIEILIVCGKGGLGNGIVDGGRPDVLTGQFNFHSVIFSYIEFSGNFTANKIVVTGDIG